VSKPLLILYQFQALVAIEREFVFIGKWSPAHLLFVPLQLNFGSSIILLFYIVFKLNSNQIRFIRSIRLIIALRYVFNMHFGAI